MSSEVVDIFKRHSHEVISPQSLQEIYRKMNQLPKSEVDLFFSSFDPQEIHLKILRLYLASQIPYTKVLLEGIQSPYREVYKFAVNCLCLYKDEESPFMSNSFVVAFIKKLSFQLRSRILFNLGKHRSHPDIAIDKQQSMDELHATILQLYGFPVANALLPGCSQSYIRDWLQSNHMTKELNCKQKVRCLKKLDNKDYNLLPHNHEKNDLAAKYVWIHSLPASLSQKEITNDGDFMSLRLQKKIFKDYKTEAFTAIKQHEISNLPSPYVCYATPWYCYKLHRLRHKDLSMVCRTYIASKRENLSRFNNNINQIPSFIKEEVCQRLFNKYGGLSNIINDKEFWAESYDLRPWLSESTCRMIAKYKPPSYEEALASALREFKTAPHPYISQQHGQKVVDVCLENKKVDVLISLLPELLSINNYQDYDCGFRFDWKFVDLNTLTESQKETLWKIAQPTLSSRYQIFPEDLLAFLLKWDLKTRPLTYESLFKYFETGKCDESIYWLPELQGDERCWYLTIVNQVTTLCRKDYMIILKCSNEWIKDETYSIKWTEYPNLSRHLTKCIWSFNTNSPYFIWLKVQFPREPVVESFLESISCYLLKSKEIQFLELTESELARLADAIVSNVINEKDDLSAEHKMKFNNYMKKCQLSRRFNAVLPFLIHSLKVMIATSEQPRHGVRLLSSCIPPNEFFAFMSPYAPPPRCVKDNLAAPLLVAQLNDDDDDDSENQSDESQRSVSSSHGDDDNKASDCESSSHGGDDKASDCESSKSRRGRGFITSNRTDSLYLGIATSLVDIDPVDDVTLSWLDRYCVNGDLMKCARDAFHSITNRLLPDDAVRFIMSVLNRPISVHKHALRALNRLFDQSTRMTLLKQRLNTDEHPTARKTLAVSLTSNGSIKWCEIKDFFDALRPIDYEAFEVILTAEVDKESATEFCRAVIEKQKTFINNSSSSSTDDFNSLEYNVNQCILENSENCDVTFLKEILNNSFLAIENPEKTQYTLTSWSDCFQLMSSFLRNTTTSGDEVKHTDGYAYLARRFQSYFIDNPNFTNGERARKLNALIKTIVDVKDSLVQKVLLTIIKEVLCQLPRRCHLYNDYCLEIAEIISLKDNRLGANTTFGSHLSTVIKKFLEQEKLIRLPFSLCKQELQAYQYAIYRLLSEAESSSDASWIDFLKEFWSGNRINICDQLLSNLNRNPGDSDLSEMEDLVLDSKTALDESDVVLFKIGVEIVEHFASQGCKSVMMNYFLRHCSPLIYVIGHEISV